MFDSVLRSHPVARPVAAPDRAVWEVLADGWLYASWVVGAARIRDVDDAWPSPGARLHHSVGAWPALISDATEVEAAEPCRSLVLTARGSTLGTARVHLAISADAPDACTVTMREDAVSGPGRLVPLPARQALVLPRNRESLRRLALLAEGRHRHEG